MNANFSNRTITIFLIFLATMLRIPGIGRPLQGDEVITFNRYGYLPWRDLIFSYHDTNQHTLFNLLSNWTMSLIGETEWVFRIPSLLTGIAAPPLLYFFSLNSFQSRQTALFSSLLLTLSAPLISYSQTGRGYSLTVFLAIILIFASRQLALRMDSLKWGSILVISGTAMAMTLPSNAIFLAGAAAYLILEIWLNQKNNVAKFNKLLTRGLIWFSILLLTVMTYFITIWEDLLQGIHNYSLAKPSLSTLSGIAHNLTEPWGPIIFIFPVLTLVLSSFRKKLLPILVLLIFPLFTMSLTGIVGFPRIYLYELPFLFLLCGEGITKSFKNSKPGISQLSVIILITALFLVPSSLHWKTNIYSRLNSKNATMSEGKLVKRYIENNLSPDSLIICLPGWDEKSVLIHYLKEQISSRMFRLINGNVAQKIYLIAHKNEPPEKFRLGQYVSDKFMHFEKNNFFEKNAIGSLKIYESYLKLNRLLPPQPDSDYEARIPGPPTSMVQFKLSKQIKVFGNQSLEITKSIQSRLAVNSVTIKTLDLKKEKGYLLLAYAKPYGQESKLFLSDPNEINGPEEIGFLNPYFGRFRSQGLKKDWQLVFVLNPFKKGERKIAENFHLKETVSYFDGIQSFLLLDN